MSCLPNMMGSHVILLSSCAAQIGGPLMWAAAMWKRQRRGVFLVWCILYPCLLVYIHPVFDWTFEQATVQLGFVVFDKTDCELSSSKVNIWGLFCFLCFYTRWYSMGRCLFCVKVYPQPVVAILCAYTPSFLRVKLTEVSIRRDRSRDHIAIEQDW